MTDLGSLTAIWGNQIGLQSGYFEHSDGKIARILIKIGSKLLLIEEDSFLQCNIDDIGVLG